MLFTMPPSGLVIESRNFLKYHDFGKKKSSYTVIEVKL